MYIIPGGKFMKHFTAFILSSAILACSAAAALHAATPASDADRTFVGQVSQGGAYEVEAGKVAEMKGRAPDIRDLGVMEAHDHEGVNAKLKAIADATGVPVAPSLNAKFQARLEKLKNTPDAQFDAYFVADMEQIHDNDQKLFAKEAVDGSASYKLFAHQTDQIVKRHLGALHGLDK
jgi:putative membrane protein